MINPQDDLPRQKKSAAENRLSRRIRNWFIICSLVLAALILARIFKLQIFVEIEFGGEPILAALTNLETYYLPLGLVLAYFIFNWAWQRYFGSGKS